MGQSSSAEVVTKAWSTTQGNVIIVHHDQNYILEHEWPMRANLDIIRPLWNDSDHGNKSAAIRQFYVGSGYTNGYKAAILSNECFMEEEPSPECVKARSPADLSEFAQIKSWMRYDDSCDKTLNEYASSKYKDKPRSQFLAVENLGECCRGCSIYGTKVDVYHWPEAGADESCLAAVGNESIHSIDWGASTDTAPKDHITYWGCTSVEHIALRLPGAASTFVTTLTSASIRQIGPVRVKQYLRDPWGPPLPCANDIAALPNRTSIPQISHPAQIKARYLSHNLSITYNVSSTPMTDTLPRTVVSGTYTLYVRSHLLAHSKTHEVS